MRRILSDQLREHPAQLRLLEPVVVISVEETEHLAHRLVGALNQIAQLAPEVLELMPMAVVSVGVVVVRAVVMIWAVRLVCCGGWLVCGRRWRRSESAPLLKLTADPALVLCVLLASLPICKQGRGGE